MSITMGSTEAIQKPKARILLAEDIALNQMVLQTQLEHYGYEVQVVNNGQEVIDALLLGKYDLVLMDMQMPVMGGQEATEKIRNDLGISNKDLPIIGITAYNIPDELKKCLENGLDDCLTIPISAEKLNTAIEAWLELGEYDPLIQISMNSPASYTNASDTRIDPEQIVQLLEYIGIKQTQSFYEDFMTDAESRLKKLISTGILSDDDIHSISGACGNLGMIRLKTLCDSLLEKHGSLSKEESLESLTEILSELDRSGHALEKFMFK